MRKFIGVTTMAIGIIRRCRGVTNLTLATLLLVVAGMTAGCSALGLQQRKPVVAVSEVVQLTQDGIAPEFIIQKMRDSKTVYRLDAAALARLHDQGVTDAVM